jgi:hypothetical protein
VMPNRRSAAERQHARPRAKFRVDGQPLQSCTGGSYILFADEKTRDAVPTSSRLPTSVATTVGRRPWPRGWLASLALARNAVRVKGPSTRGHRLESWHRDDLRVPVRAPASAERLDVRPQNTIRKSAMAGRPTFSA